jgi:sensor domain CHASE-containing protein
MLSGVENISAPDRSTYLERQRQSAKQFNLSIRQVQRLIKLWETSGITELERKV